MFLLSAGLGNWVGVSGSVLNWFHSHISGRKLFVVMGDHPSRKCELPFGVVQGSYVGHLLFSFVHTSFRSEVPKLFTWKVN